MHCLDASNQFKSISLEESQNNVSKVLENNKSPPYYYGDGHKEYLMAYERRLCGKPGPHIVNGQCADCGMQPIHSYIRYLRGPDIPRKIPSEQINQRDYFDNGPLHFAAKFKSKTPELLFRMIDMGADIHSVNTSGATFLHVLFRFMQPHQILHFLPLLRRLADLGFSFLIRDYWGRQPVHLLLKGAHSPSLDSVDRLEEVFSILKPDIDALDIDGRSARSLISNRFGQGKMKTRVSEFLSQFPWSKNSTLEFRVVLSIMDTDWSAWIKWVSLEGRSTWIDSHGDTALIALLKHWDYAQDEFLIDNRIVEMVGFGSEINMRDRHGDTALAIATQRGLRPAVESLIRLQASIHTTNFKGRGILRSAQKQMALAKQNGQDKLYAMIWSCIICLVDLKACKCPSLRRELWARWAPDSHFQWDARESEVKVEKIVRVLSESGFI
jgi:ankyrin repeat protein